MPKMISILCPQSEGVKIFIQLYKEFEPALSLGSEFAQNVLKHPNIVVSWKDSKGKEGSGELEIYIHGPLSLLSTLPFSSHGLHSHTTHPEGEGSGDY